MEDYQKRVVDEKTALDEKIVRLGDFIVNSPVFATLVVHEQTLLRDQLLHMQGYSDVLRDRIFMWEH